MIWSNESLTAMNSKSLSYVLGPVLMRPEKETMEAMVKMKTVNEIVELCIEHALFDKVRLNRSTIHSEKRSLLPSPPLPSSLLPSIAIICLLVAFR